MLHIFLIAGMMTLSTLFAYSVASKRRGWFLDGGANCGNSFVHFMEDWPALVQRGTRKVANVPKGFDYSSVFNIHLIELNPDIYQTFLVPLATKVKAPCTNCSDCSDSSDDGEHLPNGIFAIHNWGIWDEDGDMTAAHSKYKSDKCGDIRKHEEYPDGGGSLLKDRVDESSGYYIQATKNFTKWILEQSGVRTCDYTVLKLDIEGAEIRVLQDLIATNVLCEYVDVVFVEWHPGMTDANELRVLKKELASMCPNKCRYYEWLL